MARVEENMTEIQETILKDCTMESQPFEVREVDYAEFQSRMLELEFTSEEAQKAWEVLARR